MQLRDWADLWACELFDSVPVPGLATAAAWRNTVPGTTRAPGKNHPALGAWLVDQYCPVAGLCADPMFGSGGLWINSSPYRINSLEGCEIEENLSEVGLRNAQLRAFNSVRVHCGDARYWSPSKPPDLVLFSPPFLQNHTSGATDKQKLIREKKALHTMQEFGSHPDNLGRKRPSEYWAGMGSVYRNVSSYIKRTGTALIVLRNRIRGGIEVDEIGKHIRAMREAGLSVLGVHPRDLQRPTGYQAWKLARDPRTPWIRYEWIVVARPAGNSKPPSS